jgi:mRNA interferase YafQ
MTLETTAQLRRDYKRVKKRGYDMDLLAAVIDALLSGAPLDPRFRDHQ